jgi:D-arabinose 1-dehydrogenase-like Zn-dependent alcohol dehydrogenase
MRAITVDSQGAAPALREDLPEPTPADNGIIVRVHASSANPADNSIAGGILAGMGLEHQYPVTLGRDYAGVVEQTGPAVSGYRPGDQVYGFVLHANPIVHEGAWAELISVTEELSVAPAPDGVDLAIAGAAPLAGITAITAIDALDLSEGDVLLVAVPRAGSAAWPSSSPHAPEPASSRPGCPRTRSSCATSASATCCRARETSPSWCATGSPRASTRCSTSSTTRPAPTTPP